MQVERRARKPDYHATFFAESFLQWLWSDDVLAAGADPATMILGATLMYGREHGAFTEGYDLLREAHSVAVARILYGEPDDPWTKWRR